MDDLPDFDTLKQLAHDDPEALEALRLRMSEAIIANASDAMKPRLQAQLSHINHVIARGRTPNHTNMLLMSELQQQLKRFALAVTTPEASRLSRRPSIHLCDQPKTSALRTSHQIKAHYLMKTSADTGSLTD